MNILDFIEAIIIPYYSPIVCVPNPKGVIQVCIDFQSDNLNIVNDAYPMNWIKYQINLMKDYHQLIIHEAFRDLTKFIIPKGLC